MSRLLFTKEGAAIWSSHLDLMRALMRSFRRAGIDLKHSQGFTPHPELSILMPLSVGVESQCEIAEFTLAEGCEVPPREIVARLNPVLPAGIRALDCWEGGKKAGKLAWLRARLTLVYEGSGIRHQASGDGGTDSSTPLRCAQNDRIETASAVGAVIGRPEEAPDAVGAVIGRPQEAPDAVGAVIGRPQETDRIEALRALFARPSLVVEKHSKKGPVELDIAPMIRELTISAVGAVIGRPEGTPVTGRQSSGDGRTDSSTPLRFAQNDKTGEDAVIIEAVVAAQNPTLNPLLLATAIETHLPSYKPAHVRCRRLELYDADMELFR